jgi:hypothetical protein
MRRAPSVLLFCILVVLAPQPGHGLRVPTTFLRRTGVVCAKERIAGPRTAALPPPDDLSDEVMLSIVDQEMSDEDVNALIWKYLGYRYNAEQEGWDASAVFPKWAAKYPQPPDLVGVTRTYTREIDEPVRESSMSDGGARR